MPGRSFTSPTGYRYGFNGKEKLDELHGNSGDAYDYGARMYDARLGRWMSVDPVAHSTPWYSPYSALGNNPIFNIDVEGKVKIKHLTVIHNGVTIKLKMVDNNYTEPVPVSVPFRTRIGIMSKVVIMQYDIMETETINLDDPSKSKAKQQTLLKVTDNAFEKVARYLGDNLLTKSQPGGLYLVSVSGGADPTKIKSKTQNINQINVEDLLTAIGALGSISKVDAGLLSDGLDIQRSIVEELTAQPANGDGVAIPKPATKDSLETVEIVYTKDNMGGRQKTMRKDSAAKAKIITDAGGAVH